MTFWQTFSTFFSEPPGNAVYYLVTLFALQVVFAISLGQWLRHRQNRAAWRTFCAAGMLISLRLLLLLFVWWSQASGSPTAVWQPIITSFITLTAVLLVWALIPPPAHLPRLTDGLLLLTLLILGLLALTLTLNWQAQDSAIPYAQSGQATIWSVLAALSAALGFAASAANPSTRRSLHPWILLLLLLSNSLYTFQLLTNQGTAGVNWLRLSELIIFPLWAALAYRQALLPLLDVPVPQAANPQTAQTLIEAATVLHSLEAEPRQQTAVTFIQSLLPAAFVGIGVIEPGRRYIHLISNLPQANADAPRTWHTDLTEWTPFRTILRKKEGLELIPSGPGTRHLYELYTQLNLGPLGALWVEPLLVNGDVMGIMLLAKANGRTRWSNTEQLTATAAGRFIAQALHNSHQHNQAIRQTRVENAAIASGTAVSGRIIALEEEVERLTDTLASSNARAIQAENRAAEATRRAFDLAQTVALLEGGRQHLTTSQLEAEVQTLREALTNAEETLALAAADDNGISPEWVLLAITRYSGALEEAQDQIARLQAQLHNHPPDATREMLVALMQELRTPITSISGFANLLLGETMGLLGSKQRDFVQRIQANGVRLGQSVDQILQLLNEQPAPESRETAVAHLPTLLETAVLEMAPLIQAQQLHLHLEIAENLPPLTISPADMHLILTNLLANACRASGPNGHVTITAQQHRMDTFAYLQLTITDSGLGLTPAELTRVFQVQMHTTTPLIAGLGDTAAGLPMVQNLIHHAGGRIWAASTPGHGSTFTLIFPTAPDNPNPDAS